MEKNGLWTEQYQKGVEEKSRDVIDEAVRMAEAIEPQNPKDMFKYTYENLTPRQIKEIQEL
jgi:TPP-dependent pyruvate/acetoin dehydrogenase alpha subunit